MSTLTFSTITGLAACSLTPLAEAELPDPGSAVKLRHRCSRARFAGAREHLRRDSPSETLCLDVFEDTDVLHYDLQIEITDMRPADNSCTLAGSNTMTVQSKAVLLDEFMFRLRDQFVITSAFVNGSTQVTVNTVSESARIAILDRMYGLDEVFTLTIEYAGDTVSVGEFGGIIVGEHSGGIPAVATMSEPYYAHTWWPVKDGNVGTPGDSSEKSTLDLALIVSDNLTVVANGVLEGVDTLTMNRKRFRWSTRYPIEPCNVSFSATEFHFWSKDYIYPGGTMPFEFYIFPSEDTPSHRTAWEKSITILEALRLLFSEYPFIEEKHGMHHFPIEGFGSAHQTIEGVPPGLLGYEETGAAHELSHQWWGMSVACKTWNHVWLEEGFATYAEALWVEHEAGLAGPDALMLHMVQPFRKYLGPGTVYVQDSELGDLWEGIYDVDTSYAKGAWVLHMLRHVLGDDDFFEALRAYHDTFKYSAATTEDFQAICEQFYDGDGLDWFFQQWIYDEYAPQYRFAWDSVEINEQVYLLLWIKQVQRQTDLRFTMPIDVTADSKTYVVFNDSDPQYFVLPIGFYPSAVRLDVDYWILRPAGVGLVSYEPGPPTVVETSPAPGEEVIYEDWLETVTVWFHTEVNLQPSDVSLAGDRHGPQSVTVSSGSNVNPLILELEAPLLPDRYTLTIGDGVTSVASGMALDGELDRADDPGALPSGDGEPGGDVVVEFRVVSLIPAVSTWGLLAMTLLALAAGTMILRRRGAVP